MLPVNTLLQGRYQVVSPIGRGGMGAVYRAIDTRLRNMVALKQTLVEGEVARRAFEREAQLLAGMRHPALPKVFDHFTEESGQFLVMEFISGEDLGTLLLQRGHPFDVADVVSWGDRLLDALEYLHSHNPPIVHRDIKPQNMKLTDRGEIILLDFGLAKGASSAQATRSATTSSIYGYTPHYAPLEQIQGTGTNPRSDLYALAATLQHLLTGSPPPDALTRAAARINEEPDPLRPANETNPDVPPHVAAVLYQSMAQKPDQRPESAAAMRRLLRDTSNTGALATILLPENRPTQQHPVIDATILGSSTTITAPGATQAARPATGEMPAAAGQIVSGTTISQPVSAPDTRMLPQQKRPGWQIPAIGGGLIAVIIGGLVATGAFQGSPPPPTAVPTAAPQVVAGEPTATADTLATARASILNEQTATAAAQATATQIILDAIQSTDATRTAIAQATIDASSNVEQTALAETAAVVALTPTETIAPPTATAAPANTLAPAATRDPNAPTNTPRPTATTRPTEAPTVPAGGKAAILAQGGGDQFRGSASIGTISEAEGNGGSCIQGSLKTSDGSLFSDFLVGIDKGGSLRRVSYNYATGFFGACGLEAGEWGVVVYKAGGRDTNPSDQGAHQVRIRLSGTPGEVVYVNFRAVNFEAAPPPTTKPEGGIYDGQWSGTIRGTTSGGSKSFSGSFRLEVRNNAVYRISVDGADCFFDTYPNYPNGQRIDNNAFGTGGQVFNPQDNSKADISYSVGGQFNSASAATGTMRATQNGGVCLEGQWSIQR